MHTTKIGDHTFIHDGDFKGFVVVVTPGGERLPLPIDTLLDFAAEVVRGRKISQLEQASTAQLLGLE